MKKLFAIAFTCVYLLLTVGVIKNTHYCMGRINSTSLFVEAKKCPCSLFNFEKDACCDDGSDLVRIENDQTAVANFSLGNPEFFIYSDLYSEALVVLLASNVTATEDARNAERPPSDKPLFKLYCSLVFYDVELIA